MAGLIPSGVIGARWPGRASCLRAFDPQFSRQLNGQRDTMANMEQPHDVFELLKARCRSDHTAWINGDATGYALPEDGTIMGAVGGCSIGGATTAERQRAVAAQWLSGSGTIDFINEGLSGDIAWMAFIERATVVFSGDSPGIERRWDLRVTEVFRRTTDGWERVHRQADPLVDFRPLADVAALLA